MLGLRLFDQSIFVYVKFLFTIFECLFFLKGMSHFFWLLYFNFRNAFTHWFVLNGISSMTPHVVANVLKILLHVTRYSKSRTWVKKFKLTLHAMKAVRGSGSVAPPILNLGTRWRWVVIFTFQPLYPLEKDPPLPIELEDVWALELNWAFWRR